MIATYETMLGKAVKPKLLAVFTGIVTVGIIRTGYSCSAKKQTLYPVK